MIRITTTATPRPISRLWNISLHRPDLAAELDLDPLGRLAGAGDRRVEPVDHAAEVLALDVGRQAQVAPHVVAVDLAGHLAAHHAGDVADQERRRGVGRRVRRPSPACWRLARGRQRHELDVGRLGHLRRRDLHLDLVRIAADVVAPEDPRGVAARVGGGDQRFADVAGGHAAEAGPLAVERDLDGRVVERLLDLDVAERLDPVELARGACPCRCSSRPGCGR